MLDRFDATVLGCGPTRATGLRRVVGSVASVGACVAAGGWRRVLRARLAALVPLKWTEASERGGGSAATMGHTADDWWAGPE